MRHECGEFERARASGFTLVELLIVLSIIALLIGLLLPALARSRASSRGATCLTRLNQHGLALNLYLLDYDALPHEDDANPDWLCWYNAVNPYLAVEGGKHIADIKVCPEVDRTATAYMKAYRFNSGLSSNEEPFVKIERIRASDQTVVLFDAKYTGEGVSFKGRRNSVDFRHPGGANLLMADWHATALDSDGADNVIWKLE